MINHLKGVLKSWYTFYLGIFLYSMCVIFLLPKPHLVVSAQDGYMETVMLGVSSVALGFLPIMSILGVCLTALRKVMTVEHTLFIKVTVIVLFVSLLRLVFIL